MAQKPSIPKGTRDFGPAETARRNYLFDTLKTVFRQFGFAQIETPAMENLSTLLGKYGDEGDKLLFKILNSGDAFAGDCIEASRTPEGEISSNALAMKVCEKGLRYDLTVPFARFVVQHRNEITFPFKRYQMQPVWRADRPQKGRYREFCQCDVDIVGSNSLLNELELVQIVDEAFAAFGISVVIKLNNRKILAGIAEAAGCPSRLVDISVAIDKIDKIGLEAVKAELLEKGLSSENVSFIEPVLTLSGDNLAKMSVLRSLLASSEVGMTGIREMDELLSLIASAGIRQKVEVDFSLARGLNYYTGTIFEVKACDYEIGSICGGGRYDNLTGIFGMGGVSGVGISFGADRIYDVLAGLEKFPTGSAGGVDVVFANMGREEVNAVLPAAMNLRRQGISVEIYPDADKLRRQFEYADAVGARWMVIAGSDELSRGVVNVKNLATGTQTESPLSGITLE